MASVRICVWNATRQDWDCGGDVLPVAHWPAAPSEAQVGAMQGQGPDPTARGGVAAYSIWLRLINPPAPDRGPHD